MPNFNMDALIKQTSDVLEFAGLSDYYAKEFVELSLTRKERFHGLFKDDENGRLGRKLIPFENNSMIILDDNNWLENLLKEVGIDVQHLVEINKVLYVVDGKKGLPLTKAIKKKEDRLFTRGKKWFKSHPDPYFNKFRIINGLPQTYETIIMRDENGNAVLDEDGMPKTVSSWSSITPSVDKLLAGIGDVCSLKREGWITINPADILRQALYGFHCEIRTCHSLKDGAYKSGAISYALDNVHLQSMICPMDDSNLKIVGRSMVVISEDKKTIGQRRFYPTHEIFGKTRAKLMRESIHRILNPSFEEDLKQVFMSLNGNKFSGYLDNVVVWTSQTNLPESGNISLTGEVFCFRCGKIHTPISSRQLCEDCNRGQKEKI